MTQKTIYPGGVAQLTVNASESIIISNYGGGLAQIYYLTTFSNQLDAFILQQTLNNQSVTLGPFASDQTIKIDANNSTVNYNTGATPVISNGSDASSIGGYDPDDIAVLSEDETISGAWEHSAGIKASSFYSFGNTNVDDDDFITFNPGYIFSGGIFCFSGNLSTVPAGIVYMRGRNSPAISKISATNDGIFAVTTGALTGTTGTDGFMTISVDSSGVIYIENRIGLARSIGGILLANSAA